MGCNAPPNSLRLGHTRPLGLERTGGVFVEQIIRPTGLIDPVCIVRPVENQVDDLLHECKEGARKVSARWSPL